MDLTHPAFSEIAPIFAHYQSDFRTIEARHEAGEDSRILVREMTEITDNLVLQLLLDRLLRILRQDELPRHMLLLAQGGYGRRQMHPFSDVDLLFLHNAPLRGEEEELVKSVFRCLFDLGFKVGHACRSFKQALDISHLDNHSQTAMAESRFLAGDWHLFEEFKHDLWRILQRNRKELIRVKTQEREERLARQGVTINITEPHVKESPGGLRDFHFGLWIGSLCQGRTLNLLHLRRCNLIDHQTMTQVDEAVAFLWRLRNDLHFFTRKEQDVLALPLQLDISRRLGYQDLPGRLAEETMMRDYYRHALTICEFAEKMITACAPRPFWRAVRLRPRKNLPDGFTLRGRLLGIPPDLHFYEHDPRRILQTFILAARHQAQLAPETAVAIQDNLELVDQAFLHDKHHAALLREFFALPVPIDKAVQEMRQTGLLERLIPEWRGIASLVRYDLVHRYTVDEHSWLCLYHLENLRADPMHYAAERYSIWQECAHRDVLRLAVLFHDIGKGKDSGPHALTGARLVDEIARRLRLSDEKRGKLIFLVQHHLAMSHTAQHRDLSDPQVAADFTDTFEEQGDLDMMYLMTYVDMRSVSPEAMTEWKNNLLWQLYLASRDIFLSEVPAREQQQIQVLSRKEIITESLKPYFSAEVIEEHLNRLPPSYLLYQTPEKIREHLEAVQAFDGTQPVTRFVPYENPGGWEIVLACRDRVGLFNRICVAVMLENFSIFEARLNTRSDGIVVNNLVIRDALGNLVIPASRRNLLLDRIQRVLAPDGQLPPVPRRVGAPAIGRSSFENQVKISNDSSARFTVVVVRCADRQGLLVDLSSVLSSMNFNIHFARIFTEGNRVTDVFYVADAAGGKITEPGMVSALQQALQDRINPAESHE